MIDAQIFVVFVTLLAVLSICPFLYHLLCLELLLIPLSEMPQILQKTLAWISASTGVQAPIQYHVY